MAHFEGSGTGEAKLMTTRIIRRKVLTLPIHLKECRPQSRTNGLATRYDNACQSRQTIAGQHGKFRAFEGTPVRD
jgi:hypothetical protein